MIEMIMNVVMLNEFFLFPCGASALARVVLIFVMRLCEPC